MQIALSDLQFARTVTSSRPVLRLRNSLDGGAGDSQNRSMPVESSLKQACAGVTNNTPVWKSFSGSEFEVIPLQEKMLAGELLPHADRVFERILC